MIGVTASDMIGVTASEEDTCVSKAYAANKLHDSEIIFLPFKSKFPLHGRNQTIQSLCNCKVRNEYWWTLSNSIYPLGLPDCGRLTQTET
jgi:hypothetical protein